MSALSVEASMKGLKLRYRYKVDSVSDCVQIVIVIVDTSLMSQCRRSIFSLLATFLTGVNQRI